ncbi:MAG: HEAT repeat domain-containing protein [Gemmatales bacterium]|nr:HEAT repeat domain-containing protein [Gemmatales bacterium]MDW7995384.1 HEAT repeat domain-containing protein [Gemmatales bacterium]
MRRRVGLALLALLALLGVVVWLLRVELVSYYHAWCWHQAGEENAEPHASELVRNGIAAWPALSWLLSRQSESRCHAGAKLVARWLTADKDESELEQRLRQIARDWTDLGEVGQAAVVEALCLSIEDLAPSADLAESKGQSLEAGAPTVAQQLGQAYVARLLRGFLLHTQPLHQRLARLGALRLARWVATHDPELDTEQLAASAESARPDASWASAWWRWCRELASLALLDEREEVRLEAVRLACSPAAQMQEQLARRLLEKPGEPSPAVRVLLILAVGVLEAQDVAPSEELARFLHDPSEEVRQSCEQVLRARGLTARQIQLARLWTHDDPLVRAQVPKIVYEDTELDAVAWLHRLSNDPAPVVRAAAIRAAGERKEVRFMARLRELAQDDASGTVRQLARYYQQEMFMPR